MLILRKIIHKFEKNLQSIALEIFFMLFEYTGSCYLVPKIFFHIRYFLIEGEQTKNLLWLMSKNDILSPWSLIIVVRIFNGKINIWNLILMLVLESWIQKNWTFLTWFEIGWSCFGIVTYICKFFVIYTGIYGLIHTK